MSTKLGPKPDAMDTDSFPADGDFYFEMMLWERRRAERAEELLTEALDTRHVGCYCEGCNDVRKRVEAHFKEVAP